MRAMVCWSSGEIVARNVGVRGADFGGRGGVGRSVRLPPVPWGDRVAGGCGPGRCVARAGVRVGGTRVAVRRRRGSVGADVCVAAARGAAGCRVGWRFGGRSATAVESGAVVRGGSVGATGPPPEHEAHKSRVSTASRTAGGMRLILPMVPYASAPVVIRDPAER